ncbi:MAG: glutaredoxin family protein [Methylococcaceae bacterium]|jgi:glutaredoxin|nr:glutaredoxin family protein [Methylococcaceae bacterium]MDZ4156727.1 glutaredoxin family protein [Methylococcales bacterium]MDP2393369.1 glutaredoxin family protein [Methylococcaceae bacterium]MDP3018310.1 glutaredoxin family protein [Methylococcaceae bacterium]MDP3388528.1 glutaredoxin family protein [Methylococcaceae bacterium]
MHLLLFGTAGCHLCEQAEEVLSACVANEKNVLLELVDVADAENEHWQEQYAIRIPVLYHADSRKELAWPFDAAMVNDFIASIIDNQPNL